MRQVMPHRNNIVAASHRLQDIFFIGWARRPLNSRGVLQSGLDLTAAC